MYFIFQYKQLLMKNKIDGDTKSTPFPKEQLLKDIKEFLEIQSKGLSFADRYKESMTSQPYFTSSQEQYKDSNWKPDITVGLEDNSYIIFPTGKVGQTVGNTTITWDQATALQKTVKTNTNSLGINLSMNMKKALADTNNDGLKDAFINIHDELPTGTAAQTAGFQINDIAIFSTPRLINNV